MRRTSNSYLENFAKGMSAGLKGEASFQRQKLASHFVDAVVDGTIALDGVDDSMHDVLAEELDRRIQATKRGDADTKRKDKCFNQHVRAIGFENKKVHLEHDLAIDELQVRRSLMHHRGERTSDRSQADIFVVSSPSQMDPRTAWCSALCGGVVTTSEFLLTGGRRGVAIALQCSIGSRRIVFCTDRFKALHPAVFDILQCISGQGNSKWKWLSTLVDVNNTAKILQERRRNSELLVFMTRGELTRRAKDNCGVGWAG